MNDLWRVIAELGLELHPDRIAIIADKIKSIESVEQFSLVKSSFGPNADRTQVERLRNSWGNTPDMGSAEIAAALRGASATSTLSSGSTELVWTGPSNGLVPLRHTEQVLCQVIESASRKLFLMSFVAYAVDTITQALNKAVYRNVQVSILLEPSNEHGGKVSCDSVKAMKDAVPGASIFIWDGKDNKNGSYQFNGSVHAKCAVADGKLAFITSANLSNAAMERNMELGVLVNGGHLPDELHRHLDDLASRGIIEKI